MKNDVQRAINKVIRFFDKTETELDRILKYPRYKVGTTNIFGGEFTFHDSLSFYVTYKEIFEGGIYKFNPTKNKNIIIDCGANMGLSVIYFSKNYPAHLIKAFEPDPALFQILQQNVSSLQLRNVEIFNKAIWDKEETLSFSTDGGMGGRVNDAFKGKGSVNVQTVALSDFINDEVDFLKIDIEGAEDVVLRSCSEILNKAEHIFFEYHNKIKATQTLHELLALVKQAGFKYYIKESFVIEKPFVDHPVICESFDMAINVFCYKPKQ